MARTAGTGAHSARVSAVTVVLSNDHVVSILPSLEPLSAASSSAPGEPVGELASFIGLEIGRPAAFCVLCVL